jgi:hypothetical protein
LGKRREPRMQARLQVRIAGNDASGRALLRMVPTRNISRQGALLEGIQGKLKLGEIIAITYKNSRARFQVTWVGDAGTERAGQIGVQTVEPEKCIWDTTTLPPMAADMYTAPPAKERRRHRRVQCRLGAELHIEGAQGLVRVEITNLSVGGCFVEMSALPKEKSRLKLIVWVNDSKLAVKGIVVNRRPGFGTSIKFTEMTEEVHEQLRRFVQSLLGLRGR